MTVWVVVMAALYHSTTVASCEAIFPFACFVRSDAPSTIAAHHNNKQPQCYHTFSIAQKGVGSQDQETSYHRRQGFSKSRVVAAWSNLKSPVQPIRKSFLPRLVLSPRCSLFPDFMDNRRYQTTVYDMIYTRVMAP